MAMRAAALGLLLAGCVAPTKPVSTEQLRQYSTPQDLVAGEFGGNQVLMNYNDRGGGELWRPARILGQYCKTQGGRWLIHESYPPPQGVNWGHADPAVWRKLFGRFSCTRDNRVLWGATIANDRGTPLGQSLRVFKTTVSIEVLDQAAWESHEAAKRASDAASRETAAQDQAKAAARAKFAADLQRAAARQALARPDMIGRTVCRSGVIDYYLYGPMRMEGHATAYLEDYSPDGNRLKLRMKAWTLRHRGSYDANRPVYMDGLDLTPGGVHWVDVKDWATCFYGG